MSDHAAQRIKKDLDFFRKEQSRLSPEQRRQLIQLPVEDVEKLLKDYDWTSAAFLYSSVILLIGGLLIIGAILGAMDTGGILKLW